MALSAGSSQLPFGLGYDLNVLNLDDFFGLVVGAEPLADWMHVPPKHWWAFGRRDLAGLREGWLDSAEPS